MMYELYDGLKDINGKLLLSGLALKDKKGDIYCTDFYSDMINRRVYPPEEIKLTEYIISDQQIEIIGEYQNHIEDIFGKKFSEAKTGKTELDKRLRKEERIQKRNLKKHLRFKTRLENKPTKTERKFKEILNELSVEYSFQKEVYVCYFRCYFLDFYLEKNGKKIAFELDGIVHDFRKKEDEYRDYRLSLNGIKVIRIKNEEASLDLVRNILKEEKIL